jgi:hypothetical protein
MFHFASFGPAEIVGVISLLDFAAAILALYSFKLMGAWRLIYVVTALIGLYLVALGIAAAKKFRPMTGAH